MYIDQMVHMMAKLANPHSPTIIIFVHYNAHFKELYISQHRGLLTHQKEETISNDPRTPERPNVFSCTIHKVWDLANIFCWRQKGNRLMYTYTAIPLVEKRTVSGG